MAGTPAWRDREAQGQLPQGTRARWIRSSNLREKDNPTNLVQLMNGGAILTLRRRNPIEPFAFYDRTASLCLHRRGALLLLA